MVHAGSYWQLWPKEEKTKTKTILVSVPVLPSSLWRIFSALLSRNPNTKAQISENRQVTAAEEAKKKKESKEM